MPDKIHPTLPEFQKLEAWNKTALVYKHGSLERQGLKVYRYLGLIAEGVQKMKGLDVASATGNYLASLYTTCSFAGITPDEFDTLFLRKPESDWFTMQSPERQVRSLAAGTTRVMHDLAQWTSPAGTLVSRAVALEAVAEVIAVLKAFASRNGFYLDRCVVNAVNVIVAKRGHLDEFGMFRSSEWEEGDTTSQLEGWGPAVTVRKNVPSGDTIATYILHALNRILGGMAPSFGVSSSPENVYRLRELVDTTLDNQLDKYIRSSNKWRHLLFERNPLMVVSTNEHGVTWTPNEDFIYILDSLKKDK